MGSAMYAILSECWMILEESAVFMLFGFLLAALIRRMLATWSFADRLRGSGPRPVLLASLVGVPLPLCSCSVLPAALSLRRSGAGRGATLSFLVSVPETSVTSIALTYALIGPLMAIVRPLAALTTAIVAGLVEDSLSNRADEREANSRSAGQPGDLRGASTTSGKFAEASACGCSSRGCDDECNETGRDGRDAHNDPGNDGDDGGHDNGCSDGCDTEQVGAETFGRALRFAFVDLFDDIAGWMLIGIAAAALLNVAVPPELFHTIVGGPVQSMLIMLVIGVPLYICAESSTPVAATLIAQGISPGAALVFLLVGPATNLGSIGVLARQMGKKTVAVYLASVAVVAIVMGLALDMVISGGSIAVADRALNEPLIPEVVKTAGALLFVLLCLGSLYRMFRSRWPV